MIIFRSKVVLILIKYLSVSIKGNRNEPLASLERVVLLFNGRTIRITDMATTIITGVRRGLLYIALRDIPI